MSNADRTLFVVLGNHLFPPSELGPVSTRRVFMAEDLGLCTYVRHHKQKIVLFLAAMRAYRDELTGCGYDVTYRGLGPEDTSSYEDKLDAHLAECPADGLVLFEIEDRFFEDRLTAFAESRGLELTFLPSPMFLTPRSVFASYLAGAKRPFMADFYRQQRKRLDLLLDEDGKPVGGKWSYDAENRQRVPTSVDIPGTRWSQPTDHVRELIPLVNEAFAEHPGKLSEDRWWLPTTRRQALAWLRDFLSSRFADFGPYEDALSARDPVLWHSVLTPTLNLGLIMPEEVIDRATRYAAEHDVPLNSLEGFVRQIVGWREFIRGIDRHFGPQQHGANFFDHHRGFTEHWYRGDTGLVPLDDVIHKAQRFGWAHHIERLMVAGNLMLLCEIEPCEAYRWFMEMFVDSADWVMGPNVFGMGIFSDGGVFATKPYLCGSNYILKMSDYTKPKSPDLFGGSATWCDVMDGLYWRFIDRHEDYFRSNPRLATMVGTLGRMKPERKRAIFAAAEAFLDRVTEA